MRRLALLLVAVFFTAGCQSESAPTYQLSPLAAAVLANDEAKVLALIESGTSVESPDVLGYTPLMYAVGAHNDKSDRVFNIDESSRKKAERISIVSLLLKKGANPNATNNKNAQTVLGAAVYHGRADTVSILLINGANPDQLVGPWTPLMLASYHCYSDIVDLLLKGKANPILKDSRGKTASDIGKEQCAESKTPGAT